MGRYKVLLQIHATVFLSGSKRSTESQTPEEEFPTFHLHSSDFREKKKSASGTKVNELTSLKVCRLL